jgi:hypothetical protein
MRFLLLANPYEYAFYSGWQDGLRASAFQAGFWQRVAFFAVEIWNGAYQGAHVDAYI